MPEGDSVHRLAAQLGPVLVGHTVARLHLRTRGEIVRVRGQAVEAVEAMGKNLLVSIAGGDVLHLHLGLHGRTRCSPPGSPVARDSDVVLETAEVVFTARRTATAELVRAKDPTLRDHLHRLGPDVLGPDPDFDAIVARVRAGAPAEQPIADVLLDQRFASGIGNIYKSEVLFMCHIDPRTTVGRVTDVELRGLYEQARTSMAANLGPGGRVTVGTLSAARRRPDTARHWVYRRAGLPCLRCRARIEMVRSGDRARSCYFCPRCQPPRGSA